MATTDARTGFRLPWSSDERHSNQELDEGSLADGSGVRSGSESSAVRETAMNEGTAGFADSGRDREVATGRAPSKFMAELTKAMQAAAEGAREEAMGRLQSDAKVAIQQIHDRSATEDADLRRQADEDVAAVREWSKGEIARIREETDERIAARKRGLETEIEEHAGLIERQIESVQAQVAAYETRMAEFFERLLSEDDPSRFASLAENLPEPPMLDATGDWAPTREMAREEFREAPSRDQAPHETAPRAYVPQPFAPERVERMDRTEALAASPPAPPVPAAPVAPAPVAPAPVAPAPVAPAPEREPAQMAPADREAAMARIQAAAEAAMWANHENGTGRSSESRRIAFDPEPGTPVMPVRGGPNDGATQRDPRLAALAMSPDFAAAEAEAAAAAGVADSRDEIPTIGDAALAARLAGLVGGSVEDSAPPAAEANSTRVVVTGLISVASIASFKRHLGRLPGVQSVGVSSGPDGEFVFTVRHTADVILRDAITALPSFQARITGTSEGSIQVVARDPEA